MLFPDCGCKDRDNIFTVQMFFELFCLFFEKFLIFLKNRHLYLYILLYKGILLSPFAGCRKNNYLCPKQSKQEYELEKNLNSAGDFDYCRPTTKDLD